MLRVLIVDDSPTARRLIAAILGADPDIEVVGEASDGEQAVQLTQRLRPDVITMDIHMPSLNGFDATHRIMSSCPTPIVIVSASTLVHEVEWAMKALQAGALTLLLKPPGPEAPEYDRAARELVDTVKSMADVKVVRRRPPKPAPQPQPQPAPRTPRRRGQVVAIAASTGGPPAIQQVLSALPRDFACPILLVQHIAPGFTAGLVAWLASTLKLEIKIAEAGEALRPGAVYVAPEDQHLGATEKGRVLLSTADPIDGFRPSATFLFDSVGRAYQRSTIAVIMTGMGSDGVDGLYALRKHGGRVIAQDKDSCVIYGMPAAANEAGVVDVSLPPAQIANELLRGCHGK